MRAEFEHLNPNEYELFLPSPVFSALEITRELKADFLYQDSLLIENEAPFFVYVEVEGAFLHAEANRLEGSHLALSYRIDTRNCEEGSVLFGRFILSYLGGETIIPVQITIEASAQEIRENGYEIKPQSLRSTFQSVKPYTITTSKKAYSIGETALITVMNHTSYPISVHVAGGGGRLVTEMEHISVMERGVLEVQLWQGILEKYITRKLYKQPSILQTLVLDIRHEGGQDRVEVPLTFTSIQWEITSNTLDNERDYQRMVLSAQKWYNRFILDGRFMDLQEAKSRIEMAMAYESTLVDLRLFYILILIEMDKRDEVQHQINEILKFSDYYLEDHLDEFIEILNVLLDWLSGIHVTQKVREWPMTFYRQLFRLRVLEKSSFGLKECEWLYNNGFDNTHFYAHVASQMLKRPTLPSGYSRFYKRLVRWAVSKNVLKGPWLDYIDRMSHQVIRYELVSAATAQKLYELKSTEGLLKIVVDALIREKVVVAKYHGLYLKALEGRLHVSGLPEIYVRTARVNRLPIVMELLMPATLIRHMDHEDVAYLLVTYMKDPLSDKSPHNVMSRAMREFLSSCIHKDMSEDEFCLVRLDLTQKMQKQQWKELQETYSDLSLDELYERAPELCKELILQGYGRLGFGWYADRIRHGDMAALLDIHVNEFIEWLMDSRGNDPLVPLIRERVLDAVTIEDHLVWCRRLLADQHPFATDYAKYLYERYGGDRRLTLLCTEGCCGSMKEMVLLWYKAREEGVLTVKFTEEVLYKGILTRQMPEETYRIYLAYRTLAYKPSVCTHLNHFFAARILIEDPYGYDTLIGIFESDLSDGYHPCEGISPVALALLRLYHTYGDHQSVISWNLVKNAVRNGIIFPWFEALAQPFLQTGSLRKAAFFSYKSKPDRRVRLLSRADDQIIYTKTHMKHVCYGLYICYVVAFYGDRLQYYFEELDGEGNPRITESGIHVHEAFIEPMGTPNTYDTVNTVLMAMHLDDDESSEKAMLEHIRYREWLTTEMMLL